VTKTLSVAEVEAYRERGYHAPIRIFDDADAATLRGRLDDAVAKLGGRLTGRNNQKPHLLFPWLADLVRHPAILDAVEDVIGPDILCWGSQFFMKDGGDGTFVSWHQDATYWGLSTPDVVTAWIAFTPSNPLSGCMRVVPGTHRTQLRHTDTFGGKNLLSRGQEVAVTVGEGEAVDVILRPGEMSLHHVLIVHGSEPNRADHPRIGYAIRYVPTHVRQLSGERDHATLVRGTDTFRFFDHERPPEGELHPDAVARHAAIIEHQHAILYAGATQAGRRADL